MKQHLKILNKSLAIVLCTMVFISCQDEEYTPKPRGYYKINYPKRSYTTFNEAGFPYRFDYPTYSKIVKDTVFFDKKPENPYWINIDFPSLGGRIYLSYKEINAKNPLDKLLSDAFKMSYYHNKVADYIKDPVYSTPNNVHGVFYDVGGNAASAFQFFATDSVHHFLRGALYFDATPNADSLKPINEFLRTDLIHLVKTIHWQ